MKKSDQDFVDAITRWRLGTDHSKLVRAFQALNESSEAYDRGCMHLKELIDDIQKRSSS